MIVIKTKLKKYPKNVTSVRTVIWFAKTDFAVLWLKMVYTPFATMGLTKTKIIGNISAGAIARWWK